MPGESESIHSLPREKQNLAPEENGEPITQEKTDLSPTRSNASETQYPPMKTVIVVMIAMYCAMFLVALVLPSSRNLWICVYKTH
jgi:hypothetical protein